MQETEIDLKKRKNSLLKVFSKSEQEIEGTETLKDRDGWKEMVTEEKKRTRGLKQKNKSTSLIVPPPFPRFR